MREGICSAIDTAAWNWGSNSGQRSVLRRAGVGPKSVCALRGKAAFDAEDAPPAILAAQIAHVISSDLPGPGEPRDASVVFDVQAQIICLMGGGAAEAAVFGDRPLRSAASDLASAHALAQIVCRNEGSRSSFIEHCYQEALAIIEENKPVVLARAGPDRSSRAHPQRRRDRRGDLADVGTRGAGSRASPPRRMAAHPRKRHERPPTIDEVNVRYSSQTGRPVRGAYVAD
jgi:hypothetical protein